MGYFGKSITASDSYYDFTASLLHFLGWRDSEDDEDNYKEHTEKVGKEGFEGKVEEIIEWMKSNEMTIEDGIFLTYHLLIRGVHIEDERIDKLIEYCFKEDAWAKESVERRIYMNLAIEALEKYKADKTPVDIDVEYDFERYYIQEHMKRQLLSVDEIVSFFEDKAGIKIIQRCRSMYELYFIISEEDYIKIKGESIMGIKFLTLIH